jgi:hypothetical protein
MLHKKENVVQSFAILAVVAAGICLLGSRSAECAAGPQNLARELGPASTYGDVYINDAPVSLGKAVSTGDKLRTGPSGTATFSLNGQGSLKLSQNTAVFFAGDPQYLAELKSGKVEASSASVGTGPTLRAGNFVVVAVTEGEQSTSTVEALPDGGFFVRCVVGSVSVIPLEQTNALLLQAGESANISPDGELSIAPARSRSSFDGRDDGPAVSRHSHKVRWILIGLATAGAAIAAGTLIGTSSAASTSASASPTAAQSGPLGASSAASSDSSGTSTSASSGSSGTSTSTSGSSGSSSSSSGSSGPSTPPSSNPPSPPSNPPGDGCQNHKDKNKCPSPHVGISFAFHF